MKTPPLFSARHFLLALLAGLLLPSCQPERLPILGERTAVTKTVEGRPVVDTVYHTIPDFRFVDQDSQAVTPATFRDKIYVADFFFASCPTICPVMKTQLARVFEKYRDNPRVGFLSHTIDPRHDSVAVLKAYAQSVNATNGQWHFVTGNRDTVFDVGQRGYMVTARADAAAPGGALHSGAFILVDPQRRVRGTYDGTTAADVDALVHDMEILLKEK